MIALFLCMLVGGVLSWSIFSPTKNLDQDPDPILRPLLDELKWAPIVGLTEHRWLTHVYYGIAYENGVKLLASNSITGHAFIQYGNMCVARKNVDVEGLVVVSEETTAELGRILKTRLTECMLEATTECLTGKTTKLLEV